MPDFLAQDVAALRLRINRSVLNLSGAKTLCVSCAPERSGRVYRPCRLKCNFPHTGSYNADNVAWKLYVCHRTSLFLYIFSVFEIKTWRFLNGGALFICNRSLLPRNSNKCKGRFRAVCRMRRPYYLMRKKRNRRFPVPSKQVLMNAFFAQPPVSFCMI